MVNPSLPVVGNKLDIKNPLRTHGMFLAILGAVLAVLAISYGFVGWEEIKQVWGGTYRNEALFVQYGAASIFGLSLTACAISAFSNLFMGIKMMLSYFVPANVPLDLADKNSILQLLRNRTILYFEKPSSTLQLATKLFTQRFVYLVRPAQRHVERTIVLLKKWGFLLVFFIGVFVAARFMSDKMSVGLEIPFPGWVLLVGVIILAGYCATLFLVTSAPVEAAIFEEKIHLRKSGNPNNFFQFVDRRLETIRVGHFQNRTYSKVKPVQQKIEQNETNQFTGHYIIENQPVPVMCGPQLAGMVMDILGVVLIPFGFIFLLTESIAVMNTEEPVMTVVGSAIIVLFAGWFSLTEGIRLMSTAYSLFGSHIFESDLLELELEGTYTAGNIGIGDGRGGTLHSQRVSIQSDTNLTVRASRIVTFAEGLKLPRFIISSHVDEAFRERMNEWVNQFMSFKDSAGELIAPEIDENMSKLVNVNSEIESRKSAAQAIGQRVAWESDSPDRLPKFGSSTMSLDGGTATPTHSLDQCVRLVFISGEMAGAEIPLDGKPLVIGRDATQCSIILQQKDISKVHCQINKANGCWCITDMGSTYGTFVNGTRIPPRQSHELFVGVEVTLSKSVKIKLVPMQ